MKVGIIGFSTRNYIPYIEFYENILKENDIQYECIFWDRFRDDKTSKEDMEHTIHLDCKPGISKFFKLIPMYKFKFEVEKIIKKEQYTHLIILTTVPGVLINGTLLSRFKNKYILDIRDYSYEKYGWYKKIVKKLIDNSFFTAISSKGFLKFLPTSEKIIPCHNLGSTFVEEKETPNLKDKKVISIGFVGGIRYFEENCKLIDALANNKNIKLKYIGRANVDCDLENYCKTKNINNAEFQGAFKNGDKPLIYKEIDFINAIYGNTSLEVTTALPNRLYDGLVFKKPIIASQGTYLGELVEKYELGLTITTFDSSLTEKIYDYWENFNRIKFEIRSKAFLEEILKEQKIYLGKIYDFLN